MKNILVTGGAGYIGSHTCLALSKRGHTPVTYDDLSNGHREFVAWGPLEVGNIRDKDRLATVFREYKPVAIVHFAGLIEVGHSFRDPAAFFEINVGGSIALLSAALKAGVEKIVFSSTCATYGIPQGPLKEDHLQLPINPYGQTKLMVEQVLRELSAHTPLRFASLRYFNAAGADPDGQLGEWHDPETHAIPLAIEAALAGKPFKIFGSDYPTRDGTCIRDFVHVSDLAEAHCLALECLLRSNESIAVNLGTGVGTSVREIVELVENTSGRKLPIEYLPRRAGDPSELVAENGLARSILNWQPRFNSRAIIETAWRWHHGRLRETGNPWQKPTIF
jgi:UDP-glucose 4-epimerase